MVLCLQNQLFFGRERVNFESTKVVIEPGAPAVVCGRKLLLRVFVEVSSAGAGLSPAWRALCRVAVGVGENVVIL